VKRSLLAPWIALLAGCASGPEPVRLEDWMRVGVDPAAEAARVAGTLRDAGFEVRQRAEGEAFVALAFARPDGRKAIRVVTRRGVVVALDSHEADGVRERHGAVRLVALDAERGHDVDGDGRPEVVVARDADGASCLAIVRLAADGRATVAPTDAEALAPGACPAALEDVDGDDVREALVELRWPQLALEPRAVPSLRAALVHDDGAWRASGMPVVYAARERRRREEALTEARRALDVAEAVRLAVELAALAHLTGASVAAQVERFDGALAGLVLTEAQLARVEAIRAVIGAGWQADAP
jgi:hypothetical protein